MSIDGEIVHHRIFDEVISSITDLGSGLLLLADKSNRLLVYNRVTDKIIDSLALDSSVKYLAYHEVSRRVTAVSEHKLYSTKVDELSWRSIDLDDGITIEKVVGIDDVIVTLDSGSQQVYNQFSELQASRYLSGQRSYELAINSQRLVVGSERVRSRF